MAYISQEKKKELAPAIKAVLKKYGMKGTVATNNHSSLVVNIKSGALDLIGEANAHNKQRCERTGDRFYEITDYYSVNTYHPSKHGTSDAVENFFVELIDAMKDDDWFDKSDSQTDYFHIAWYLDINVGRWNKPYQYTGA